MTLAKQALSVGEYGLILDVRGVGPQQSSHMILHALSQWGNGTDLRIVSALKHADKAALGALVGDLLKVLCQPLEVKLIYLGLPTAMQVISLVGIETSRHQNEVGLEGKETRKDLFLERPPNLLT